MEGTIKVLGRKQNLYFLLGNRRYQILAKHNVLNGNHVYSLHKISTRRKVSKTFHLSDGGIRGGVQRTVGLGNWCSSQHLSQPSLLPLVLSREWA